MNKITTGLVELIVGGTMLLGSCSKVENNIYNINNLKANVTTEQTDTKKTEEIKQTVKTNKKSTSPISKKTNEYKVPEIKYDTNSIKTNEIKQEQGLENVVCQTVVIGGDNHGDISIENKTIIYQEQASENVPETTEEPNDNKIKNYSLYSPWGKISKREFIKTANNIRINNPCIENGFKSSLSKACSYFNDLNKNGRIDEGEYLPIENLENIMFVQSIPDWEKDVIRSKIIWYDGDRLVLSMEVGYFPNGDIIYCETNKKLSGINVNCYKINGFSVVNVEDVPVDRLRKRQEFYSFIVTNKENGGRGEVRTGKEVLELNGSNVYRKGDPNRRDRCRK